MDFLGSNFCRAVLERQLEIWQLRDWFTRRIRLGTCEKGCQLGNIHNKPLEKSAMAKNNLERNLGRSKPLKKGRLVHKIDQPLEKGQCGTTLGKGALPETFEKGGNMFHIRNDT